MAKSQVISREAKVDFDEDVLEGEKTKSPNNLTRNQIQIDNSRYLVGKYAWIFVRGHYLFREANSFPRAKLEENCEL